MTETEQLLENALSALSAQYESDLLTLANELAELRAENDLIRTMFSETTKQNEEISEQLATLLALLKP